MERRRKKGIQVIGSILEGGGQILRNCVAYAAILGLSVEIVDIRGGRPKPGLQHQHLTGLQLAAELCNAETSGLQKDSKEITFKGNGIKHGSFTAKIQAGACTLMAQISLPIALFASQPSTLILHGGTNVPFSPPAEYLKYVLIPMLGKFGVEGVELDCVRKGFLPRGGGEIQLKVQATPGFRLNSAALDDRGCLTKCTAFFTGFCTESFEKEVTEAIAGLRWETDPEGIAIETNTTRASKEKSTAVQLLFVAETENGIRIGASALSGKKTTGKKLVKDAFEKLGKQLEKEVCADEYLQDQLILFMALAQGTSRMRCGEVTLHTKTAIHFATVMTGAEFQVQEVEPGVNLVTCEGIAVSDVLTVD